MFVYQRVYNGISHFLYPIISPLYPHDISPSARKDGTNSLRHSRGSKSRSRHRDLIRTVARSHERMGKNGVWMINNLIYEGIYDL
jgi:hypothetical protein